MNPKFVSEARIRMLFMKRTVGEKKIEHFINLIKFIDSNAEHITPEFADGCMDKCEEALEVWADTKQYDSLLSTVNSLYDNIYQRNLENSLPIS